MIALTRAVPASLEHCELTHRERVPINLAKARLEHKQYEAALESLGCTIMRLPELPEQPDSVFVEDTAVVLEECAVLARPGAASRRREVASMREALDPYRDIFEIVAPGTLDGGDVLVLGKRLFVGISTRTNVSGAHQLRDFTAPLGYTVTNAHVDNCLHLKSAVTALTNDLVIVNEFAVSADTFGTYYQAAIPDELHAANVLAVGDTILCPADAPATIHMIEAAGFTVIPVDNAELTKAEAGLTCCSVLIST
ncbi:MAG TPA: arginine deiminase family protein [Longimicrobiales bacterium]|nr:arginine deiminase family protein [Longimicrobiales bacterium]